MRVYKNPAAADELVRKSQDYLKEKYPRAEGVHVSDLIRCRVAGWYERNGYAKSEHSTETLTMFLMGQGHHAVLENGQPEYHLEVDMDGIRITGTVDKMEWDVDPKRGTPAELKTTKYSAKKMVWEMQHYVEQLASYCVMHGATFGRIHVFHMMGDYAKQRQPVLHTWEIEFSEDELSKWESVMKQRARLLMSDTIPPLSEHRDWECEYCPFNVKRGGPCEATGGSKMVYFVSETELEDAVSALRASLSKGE